MVYNRGKRIQSFKSVFYSSIFHARSCHLGPLWVLCWIILDIKQLDLSSSSCHYSYQTGTLLAGYIISRMDYQLLFMVLWFSGGSQNDVFFEIIKHIVAGLKCWSSQYFVRSPVHNLQWITILKYSIPPVTISLPQWVKYRQFVEIYMHGWHLATDVIKIRLSKSKKPSRVHDLESWCVGYQKPHISVTKRIVVHSF